MAPIRMDDLKLIELVEKNKHLYDKNHIAYHDMAKKSITWKAIAAALGSSVEECRRRFRCLRDRFTKEKRATQRTKEDMLEDPLLPIIYKKMIFLWDHLLHRGSSGGNSEMGTKEMVESPEVDEGEREEPLEILNKLAKFGDVEEVISEVEIQEVIICNDKRNVRKVHHPDDLAEKMDSDKNSPNKSDDTGSARRNLDAEMDSDVSFSNESSDNCSTGKNPDAEMNSNVNLSNKNNEGCSAEKSESKSDIEMDSDSHLSNVDKARDSLEKIPGAEIDYVFILPDDHSCHAGSTENNAEEKLSKEHSSDDLDSAEKDVEMDSRVNLSKEPSKENNAGSSKEKVPGEISAWQQEESEVPNMSKGVIFVVESGELKGNNCEVQIASKRSILTEDPNRTFHTYTKNSENVPPFKRRRKQTSLLISNQRKKQCQDSSVSDVPPVPKPLNTTKFSKTSKATNAAFCRMIKLYLDKINRRDRLSATRLQILKILHDELYSSYK